jgi:hypothetical protein
MPGSSNTSFIPKRNPALKEKSAGKRQVYIGTFIVRILFVAVLIGTIGVFLYERKLQSNLDAEVVALSTAIATFNEAEMQRVLETDRRIQQVAYRLDHSASIVSLLGAVEAATVGSAQITAFNLERTDDKSFQVTADLNTGSFDTVLFQRNILENSNTLVVEDIKEITIDNPPPNTAAFASETANLRPGATLSVAFQAVLSVTTDTIPHTLDAAPVVEQIPTPVVVPAVVPEEEVPEAASINQEPI